MQNVTEPWYMHLWKSERHFVPLCLSTGSTQISCSQRDLQEPQSVREQDAHLHWKLGISGMGGPWYGRAVVQAAVEDARQKPTLENIRGKKDSWADH